MAHGSRLHKNIQLHVIGGGVGDQLPAAGGLFFLRFHRGCSPSRTRPREPSTVIHCPSVNVLVPLSVPITAGTPYSRATMAACEADPPVSTTTAAAYWNRGVQAGLVTGATRTSPGRSFPNCEAS